MQDVRFQRIFLRSYEDAYVTDATRWQVKKGTGKKRSWPELPVIAECVDSSPPSPPPSACSCSTYDFVNPLEPQGVGRMQSARLSNAYTRLPPAFRMADGRDVWYTTSTKGTISYLYYQEATSRWVVGSDRKLMHGIRSGYAGELSCPSDVTYFDAFDKVRDEWSALPAVRLRCVDAGSSDAFEHFEACHSGSKCCERLRVQLVELAARLAPAAVGRYALFTFDGSFRPVYRQMSSGSHDDGYEYVNGSEARFIFFNVAMSLWQLAVASAAATHDGGALFVELEVRRDIFAWLS